MIREITRATSLKPIQNKFCPGCLHSMIWKFASEALDELEIAQKTIVVMPVGCGTIGMTFLDMDMISAPHGRAPAVATGIKRTQSDAFVFTYQGDGDLASIGMSEIIYAANRGEKFSVIFVNNSTYGMTGGQMAPTTLVGQKSTTTPHGRNPDTDGYPIDMCALLSSIKAPSFITRCALDTPTNMRKAKVAIKKAFQYQLDGKSFSFVEILSNCVTGWGLTPIESLKFITDNTVPIFPLGVFRDICEGV